MGLEGFINPEKRETGREKLLLLEKEGGHVFHGSFVEITELKPKQAQKFDETLNQNINDGEPAVFATQFADAAIFRALVSEKETTGDSSSSFGIDEDGLHFAASRNLIEAARDKKGKVYVLDRQMFRQTGGTELRCNERIKPEDVVEVSFEDLPSGIKIREN
jgi:hypothetical protein